MDEFYKSARSASDIEVDQMFRPKICSFGTCEVPGHFEIICADHGQSMGIACIGHALRAERTYGSCHLVAIDIHNTAKEA